MAIPAYSTVFLETSASGGFSATTYTVPAGFLIVVRDILIMNEVAAVGTSGVYADVRTDTNFVLFNARYPDFFSGVPYAWEGRQVLTAGQQLRCFCSDGSPGANFRVSGYLLSVS